ncbi:MAG: response regulator transcription factor [Ignavibacteriales bacterium]|nr:response regulator transcription factor [Ignavibacteriales bacterium]
MQKKVSIVIADDHPIFRKGLSEIISSEESFIISAETGDGKTAVKLIEKLKPDVAILDIRMPGLTGFEVVNTLRGKEIGVKIIFLTMHKEEEVFFHAMDIGVSGYVLKESATDDIIECIKGVINGKHYISPQISDLLLNREKLSKDKIEKTGLNKLSPSERLVLKLISEKKTSKEIADVLFISKRTVENHRMNICNKLELHGINSLIKFAIENKQLF